MKIVALLSGGKDSCYNLVQCEKNGHILVAAASLGPASGKEELDSYMYQTVGQDAIELVAQALEVPLYRRVITGSAVQKGSEYGSRQASKYDSLAPELEGDETEDLYELLKVVKGRHPDVEGVSVGAILSNYQRVRVEHVCRRLSLTALSYLWQRDQSELLSEMIEAGVEAILIKVAGVGLKEKHLGQTLAEMQPTLMCLHDLYGSHICGEGGEYETLTLNCPIFKHRIQLDRVETVIHSPSDFAPVAYLRILDANLVSLDEGSPPPEIVIPPILEAEFESIRASSVAHSSAPPETPISFTTQYSEQDVPTCLGTSVETATAHCFSVANVQHNTAEVGSIEDECSACWYLMEKKLKEHSLSLSDIAHVDVYLSSMSVFPDINAAMYKIFGTSPPTRACVAVDLPPPSRVRLAAVAFRNSSADNRHALHVQGLSYWAPANIGPYSQSIMLGPRIFVSGQIGLLPSSMTLPSPPSVPTETSLAIQHARRIVTLTLTNVGSQQGAEIVHGLILWLPRRQDIAAICAAWRRYAEIYGPQPTGLIVGAKELPKGAQVEAQFVFHSGRPPIADESEDDEPPERVALRSKYELEKGTRRSVYWENLHCRLMWEITPSPDRNTCTTITFKGDGDVRQAIEYLRTQPELASKLQSSVYIRAFYTEKARKDIIQDVSKGLFGEQGSVTPIPARFLATMDSAEWDVALCMMQL